MGILTERRGGGADIMVGDLTSNLANLLRFGNIQNLIKPRGKLVSPGQCVKMVHASSNCGTGHQPLPRKSRNWQNLRCQ